MYKVYADDILIHDSRSPENVMHLISPNLTLVDSAAGSFDMTVPPENPGYDVIERMVTTIKIKKDNLTIWTGRVINETEDFAKRRKFSCEGALSFLNDTLQELAYYDNYTITRFFTAIIDIHNSKVPNNRQFLIGTISVKDTKEGFEYKTEYKNTLESLNDNLFSRLVGHVRVRYAANSDTPIIDYLADYPNVSDQDINFGSNLLDFTKNWDLSNLVTVIYPRGTQLEEENDHGDKDYVTIATVNNGNKYLANPEAVAAFGRIERTVDFNEIDNPSTLLTLGRVYLTTLQFDDMVLTISAIDLHLLNPEIVSFELLDQVKCYSAPHGLDKIFPITQIDIPLDAPENVKYTMGSSEKSDLTSKAVKSSKAIQNEITITGENLLGDAKHQATQLINQKTTGYVNIITEQETSQALIISDKPDLKNATKLWRWNLNGLGYLDMTDPNNPNHNYKLAITSAGEIVADFITTGMLSDGYGLNKWNLSTGEFQLAYNTDFASRNGNTITIVDVVQLAQEGIDAAEEAQVSANTAQDTADDAMHKQIGSTNILRGTNQKLQIVNGKASNWEEGTWDGRRGSATQNGSKTVVDISGAPNPSITKGFLIKSNRNDNGTYCVQQCSVKVAQSNVYTVSCYAKCNNPNSDIQIGYHFPDNSDSDYTAVAKLTNTWKRYSKTFSASRDTVDIFFGVTGSTNSVVECYICGMKLERGNTASDWSESEWDTYGLSTTASAEYTDATADGLKEYTVKYTDTISKNDREFTKSQRKALDESFTQYKVLQRLTNNFSAKGIYLKNNQLYMNADYVRTGTLDAGIVKTGILTDSKQRNKWNMTSGYLYTKNMEAENMRASGDFECGDYYKIKLKNGNINGYQGTTWVGSISPTANITNITTGARHQGLMLRGKGAIDIRCPELSVRNKNDDGVSTTGYTGTIKFQSVQRIRGNNDGSITWYTATYELHTINGIIVGYQN